jgi:hypothetical protein
MPRWRRTLHAIEAASVFASPLILAAGWWPYLVVLAIVWVLDVVLARRDPPDPPPGDIRDTYNVRPVEPLAHRRGEDPEVTARRIEELWPAGRRTADGPVRLVARSTPRRPTVRQREVIASWDLGHVADQLPW